MSVIINSNLVCYFGKCENLSALDRVKQSYQQHIWEVSGAEVCIKYAFANIRAIEEKNGFYTKMFWLVSFCFFSFTTGLDFQAS